MEKKDIDSMLNQPSKVHWACRRGMLELDVMLGQFFNEVYPNLLIEDKIRFIKVLEMSDPQLFHWLLGTEIPEAADDAYIIEKIKNYARLHL